MRISKQLLEYLKFLMENILLKNKQIGNHSIEKENIFTKKKKKKKKPTRKSGIEGNTTEKNSLDRLKSRLEMTEQSQ